MHSRFGTPFCLFLRLLSIDTSCKSYNETYCPLVATSIRLCTTRISSLRVKACDNHRLCGLAPHGICLITSTPTVQRIQRVAVATSRQTRSALYIDRLKPAWGRRTWKSQHRRELCKTNGLSAHACESGWRRVRKLSKSLAKRMTTVS